MSTKLLLYSSGYDSTLMLLEALQVSDVSILYVHGRQSPIKATIEMSRMNGLLRYLKLYPQPFKVAAFHLVANPVSEKSVNAWCGGLSQPIYWMIAATLVPYYYEEVAYGCIVGDDCTLFTAEIHEFWNALQIITNRRQYTKLTMPILSRTKAEIVNTLHTRFPFAVRYTHTCQGPNSSVSTLMPSYTEIRHCGECISCASEKVTFHKLGLPLNKKTLFIPTTVVTENVEIFNKETSFVRSSNDTEVPLLEDVPTDDS